ncbi:MAG TPA: hypothetical protein VJC12_01195 [Candidatus Paceibacterota bacterium]
MSKKNIAKFINVISVIIFVSYIIFGLNILFLHVSIVGGLVSYFLNYQVKKVMNAEQSNNNLSIGIKKKWKPVNILLAIVILIFSGVFLLLAALAGWHSGETGSSPFIPRFYFLLALLFLYISSKLFSKSRG